jgi:hypothetical protein
MSDSFEGDLIRPLGLVTLYFGYAEAQVSFLLTLLRNNGVDIEVSPTTSFGYRIKEITKAIKRLSCISSKEVLDLLEESKLLTERRNSLIHAGIFSNGRVKPNDPKIPEYRITPESLNTLADEIWNWKERLNAAVQMRLIPELNNHK